MTFETKIGDVEYFLTVGDLTEADTDAIVNAANSSLLGGGGVDGAIHRKGGPQILAECEKIIARQGECPAGEAVITSGGKLKSKYVIHTVGPFWSGGDRGEDEKLALCHTNSLRLAIENHLTSIAFPAISTGAYRFPLERAATISQATLVVALKNNPGSIRRAGFILFSETAFAAFKKTFPSV